MFFPGSNGILNFNFGHMVDLQWILQYLKEICEFLLEKDVEYQPTYEYVSAMLPGCIPARRAR